MSQTRSVPYRVDAILLMFVAAWALATPILYMFVYNFFASSGLPRWAQLPLMIVFSMANESWMMLTDRVIPPLSGFLWITGLGSFVIGVVLATCSVGLWRGRAWATSLLFGIALCNVIVLSIYLISLGIPDMLRLHAVNTSYQAILLTLAYYSSVVVRFALRRLRT